MKRFFFILFAAALFAGTSVNAQSVKIGVINTQDLIALMPERDSAESKLKVYQADLEEQAEAMRVEFNTKFDEYQKKSSTMSDLIRQQKEKELQDIQTRFTEFQENAQQDFQNVQYNLMAPVYQKAQEAIRKVAKDNSVTIVMDLSSLLYHDEAATLNMLPLVKKELGIK